MIALLFFQICLFLVNIYGLNFGKCRPRVKIWKKQTTWHFFFSFQSARRGLHVISCTSSTIPWVDKRIFVSSCYNVSTTQLLRSIFAKANFDFESKDEFIGYWKKKYCAKSLLTNNPIERAIYFNILLTQLQDKKAFLRARRFLSHAGLLILFIQCSLASIFICGLST